MTIAVFTPTPLRPASSLDPLIRARGERFMGLTIETVNHSARTHRGICLRSTKYMLDAVTEDQEKRSVPVSKRKIISIHANRVHVLSHLGTLPPAIDSLTPDKNEVIYSCTRGEMSPTHPRHTSLESNQTIKFVNPKYTPISIPIPPKEKQHTRTHTHHEHRQRKKRVLSKTKASRPATGTLQQRHKSMKHNTFFLRPYLTKPPHAFDDCSGPSWQHES